MIEKQLFLDTFKAFDKEVVVEIINIFFEEYPERFSKMDKNIAELNFKELAFNAHSLKGVVSNFAAPILFELAREVENYSTTLRDNNNQSDIIEKLIYTYPKMKRATAELYTDLKEMEKYYI
ncbi:MAG: Hpt domain-containing protein [Bacteroidetes bacterium]|nr:Hpt domain-containing protein [Bacteroidota bacterium]